MKITQKQLKNMIKEEYRKLMNEAYFDVYHHMVGKIPAQSAEEAIEKANELSQARDIPIGEIAIGFRSTKTKTWGPGMSGWVERSLRADKFSIEVAEKEGVNKKRLYKADSPPKEASPKRPNPNLGPDAAGGSTGWPGGGGYGWGGDDR